MDQSSRRSNGGERARSGQSSTIEDHGFTRDRLPDLLASLQDAIVEFRMDGGVPTVVGVNPAFEETFGYEAGEIRGESLNEYIVPDSLSSEARSFDRQTRRGGLNHAVVRRRTVSGVRSFLYRSIPYTDDDGARRGFAVYTDITTEVQRERRLQVLHRLLRHNLRNDLEVIGGYTQLLAEELDDPRLLDWLGTVRDHVDHLEHLGREATQVQRVLEADADAGESIDVSQLCRRTVAECRDAYPMATIEGVIADGLRTQTTEHVQYAISNLVENAIEHNPADEPAVRLTVLQPEADGSWVEIHVEDDGPEIPDVERDTVTSGEDVTQLEHGEGLGLWLVRWLVTRNGGEVAFRESESLGGNRVVLRLPTP